MSVGGGEWGQRFQVQVGVAVGGAMALAIAMVIVTAMAAVVGMMATGAGATRRNQQSGAEMPPSLLHGAGDTAIPSTGHPWWRRNSLMGTLPTCLRLGSSGSSGSSAAGGLRIARAGLADQMALRVRGEGDGECRGTWVGRIQGPRRALGTGVGVGAGAGAGVGGRRWWGGEEDPLWQCGRGQYQRCRREGWVAARRPGHGDG